MSRIHLYYLSTIILLCGFYVHLNSAFTIYRKLILLDIVPHSMSGFALGIFFSNYIGRHSTDGLTDKQEKKVVWIVFGFAFLWEIAEYVTNMAGYPINTPKYFADTVKDICVGIIGGIIAVYSYRKLH